jgi:hypothetical protein
VAPEHLATARGSLSFVMKSSKLRRTRVRPIAGSRFSSKCKGTWSFDLSEPGAPKTIETSSAGSFVIKVVRSQRSAHRRVGLVIRSAAALATTMGPCNSASSEPNMTDYFLLDYLVAAYHVELATSEGKRER